MQLTQERLAAPKDFDRDEYLKGSFTVFKGNDDYEVVLDFDVWATDLVRGRRWHPKQEFTELPNGCSRLRLHLNSIQGMDRFALSWETHAAVVRPRGVATPIFCTASELESRYIEFA